MEELLQFLRDRTIEDKQAAKRAKPGPWYADGGGVYATDPTDEVVSYTESSAPHIARHNPARVLTEIDAKRRIIADYEDAERSLTAAAPGTPPHDIMTGATNTLRRTLRLLALSYADHPGYREEWRP